MRIGEYLYKYKKKTDELEQLNKIVWSTHTHTHTQFILFQSIAFPLFKWEDAFIALVS